MQDFTHRVITLIGQIPAGQVATYGQIATMAGNHRAARQVSRVLHSCSQKYQLPWHRVIGAGGRITIPKDLPSHQRQLKKLQSEGIQMGLGDTIDLSIYQWPGTTPDPHDQNV
ncbi:MGMT family protein [Marinicella meishanensis]|uniref:MGMT family protein n=1 Tax=Marinicella meishanensis TaxID=2873263 RepID=UPI001CBEDA80